MENVSLGKFISSRIKYMGLTQEELAERVGVSKSAIAKWETDGGIPDRDNLKRLSEIINVSVDDLHHIIGKIEAGQELNINITSDVIAVLESYGYRVTRKKEKEA